MNDNILEVKDLSVDFTSYGGAYSVIRNCSYTVKKGEVMAIVGESGSGKSVLTQTTVRLTPGVITGGQILFEGTGKTARTNVPADFAARKYRHARRERPGIGHLRHAPAV